MAVPPLGKRDDPARRRATFSVVRRWQGAVLVHRVVAVRAFRDDDVVEDR